MKPQRPFFLKPEDNHIVADFFGEEPSFRVMDMEDDNLKDAFLALAKDELEAVVSEDHGGIIGYVVKDVSEEVTTVLNLHYIQREES